MNKIFHIYLDRLKEGQISKVKETIPSDFLDIQEADLSFAPEVDIAYEAYLADEHLVIHYSASTKGFIPCSVCNEKIELPLEVMDEYHTEPLEAFRERLFDASDIVREALLLQVPAFGECEGNCPERVNMGHFLKKPAETQEKTYHPFSDL